MTTPVVVTRIQNRRGTQDQFNGVAGIYPSGYDGVGGYNPPGSGPIGFTATAYPNVLLPGEIAFCTDSRRIFMGNISGEYVELALGTGSDGVFTPLSISLPPVGVMTVIPALTYTQTPFMKLMYSLTDSLSPDWNTLGPTFSRNGWLEITAVSGTSTAVLSDFGTEVNDSAPSEIYFEANLSGSNIEISYMHDFAGNITFSTSSFIWAAY